MCFITNGGRNILLARNNNPWLVRPLTCQVRGHGRVIRGEASDKTGDETIGLKPFARELSDEVQREVDNLLRLSLIDLFLGQVGLELLMQILGESRHGGGGEM
jgi:hypothetical protein